MQKICWSIIFLLASSASFAQDCDELYVDISKGTLNTLSPKATQEEVKKALPCFSGTTADGSPTNCGGGVFYSKQNVFFYTGKDNINIRKGFTGKCSVEIIGKTEEELTAQLGKPEGELTDEDGVKFIFFKRSYGCIVVSVGGGKAKEFFMYAVPADEVDLCV